MLKDDAGDLEACMTNKNITPKIYRTILKKAMRATKETLEREKDKLESI